MLKTTIKGIILAGGNGRRLDPLTKITNKHLLPVYDRPMVMYPLQTLLDAGIREILIVTGKNYAGGFIKLLGSGHDFGCKITYETQDEALGIAHALSLAEDFADKKNIMIILGDNIFEASFKEAVDEFEGQKGARIFLKETREANRFGVAVLDDDKVVSIEEKPKKPKTNYAVTGCYFYDNDVFDAIRSLKPSERNELEITDVNNYYIKKGLLQAFFIDGNWTDAGTFESLYRANTVARKIAYRRLQVRRIEDIARKTSSKKPYKALR